MIWDWMEDAIEKREIEPAGLKIALEKLQMDPSPRARAYEAEVFFWIADTCPKDERLGYFEKAVDSARKGMKEDSGDVSIPFWLGTNLGLLGQEKGILSSLFLLGEVESNIRLSLKRDPSFFFGAPHRALGWLLHKLPPWPISSGDSRKGYEHLLQAIELGDGFPLNHLYAGEIAFSLRKKKESKQHLDRVSDWPKDGKHDKEYQGMKDRALELLSFL